MMGDVLQALEVPPLLGRWLEAGDEVPNSARHVMLSYGYWQRRFGGDPNVVGRTITVDAAPTEIVGVMPQGFRVLDAAADLLRPIPSARTGLAPYPFYGKGVARLKPGVSIEQANADLARLCRAGSTDSRIRTAATRRPTTSTAGGSRPRCGRSSKTSSATSAPCSGWSWARSASCS